MTALLMQGMPVLRENDTCLEESEETDLANLEVVPEVRLLDYVEGAFVAIAKPIRRDIMHNDILYKLNFGCCF